MNPHSVTTETGVLFVAHVRVDTYSANTQLVSRMPRIASLDAVWSGTAHPRPPHTPGQNISLQNLVLFILKPPRRI
jgi:hypothetical protein